MSDDTIEPVLGDTKTEAKAEGEQPEVKADAKTDVKVEQKAPDADAKAFDEKVAAAIKARDEKAAAEAKTKGESEKATFEKLWAEPKFKAPEGVQRDEAALKEFVPLAKELGLKPEQAQKLLDLSDKLNLDGAKAAKAAQQKALADESEAWGKSLKADKEFGGAKYEQTIKEANKAFEKYADPELKKFLDATGLNRHPGLLKSFARIGAAMRNDNIDGTQSSGTPKTAEQALAGLYKNSPGLFPKS